MAKKYTLFQNIDKAFSGDWGNQNQHINSYDMSNADGDIIYKTTDKADYETKKLELQQNSYLRDRWVKANVDLSVTAYAGLNNVKLMYRDADLMDSFPEIGAALDIVSEESCLNGDTKIQLLNGEVKTIEELYNGNYQSFEVYAVDSKGKCKPSQIEKVICNGEKRLYEIGLNDGTIIKCTNNHLWLVEENKWKRTDDLTLSDSLLSIYVESNDNFVNKLKNKCKALLHKEEKQRHTIRYIKDTNEVSKVYDLANSSCNHCFAVKCNNGHIISHNCITSDKGMVVNVYSKSDRIKSILEDLFVNRLNIQVTAPMVVRAMCKYGNQFMLLDIDNKLGVKGWKQLPVFNMERIENGLENPYSQVASTDNVDMSTKFVWQGGNNSQIPFRNWQITHFRLLTNSLYLPYGMSYLNAARRHWRMLSLMEDMMLIYRLERSIERRVYKIYVGAIDDADVQAYVENIANNFKRTQIIDPMTGQIDLRKNILPVHKNTPIPLLDGRTITIENLANEFNEGKENYVYSVQDNTHQIVAGKVVWCGKNYTADKLYRITLDDDTYFDLAAEHELIMRDGSKKRADEVEIGESVMPFYQRSSGIANHVEIYNPNTKRYEYTENLFGDGDKIKQIIFTNRRYKLERLIKNIEIIDGDDVYCMTVTGLNGEDDRHNFAIRTINKDNSWCQNGCFVSNCVDQDLFIPVRDQNAPTPIDTLSAAQNLTAMDDIKFVQNKVCTALRIPKTFLNFEEAEGNGQNLALQDIRFTRTVNRIQQAFLMELTKVASIHLYLLGFTDDLTNFNLSMNNPSTQAEQLEIDNIQKKISAARDAISDPGNGIPIMSQTRALKEIMKWSEKEIKDNLEEIRLEKGIAAELEKTSQIIKRTGLFDNVDRMYGEPGAEYQGDVQQQGMPDGGGLGGGSLGGGPSDFGNGLDNIGEPTDNDMGDISGAEGTEPTADMSGGSDDTQQPMESKKINKPLLNEAKKTVLDTKTKADDLFSKYLKRLDENNIKKKQETSIEKAEIYDKSLLINEEFNKMINGLEDKINDNIEKVVD